MNKRTGSFGTPVEVLKHFGVGDDALVNAFAVVLFPHDVEGLIDNAVVDPVGPVNLGVLVHDPLQLVWNSSVVVYRPAVSPLQCCHLFVTCHPIVVLEGGNNIALFAQEEGIHDVWGSDGVHDELPLGLSGLPVSLIDAAGSPPVPLQPVELVDALEMCVGREVVKVDSHLNLDLSQVLIILEESEFGKSSPGMDRGMTPILADDRGLVLVLVIFDAGNECKKQHCENQAFQHRQVINYICYKINLNLRQTCHPLSTFPSTNYISPTIITFITSTLHFLPLLLPFN